MASQRNAIKASMAGGGIDQEKRNGRGMERFERHGLIYTVLVVLAQADMSAFCPDGKDCATRKSLPIRRLNGEVSGDAKFLGHLLVLVCARKKAGHRSASHLI